MDSLRPEETALVLEGGGMRGAFTSGALDFLMDNEIRFPYAIGVSAGGSNGLSYASCQRGRARFCNIDALAQRHYIGLKYILKQRSIMDMDFLFGELPLKMYPFDFQTYLNFGEFKLVATNCETGKAEYFGKVETESRLLDICKASCSLPYACPMVEIDDKKYLDGGITDAIPIKRALQDGYARALIILTRNKGYQKKSIYNIFAPLLYKKYPKLLDSLKKAHDLYNQSLEFAENLEKSGDALIIRPQNPLTVDRLEANPQKLATLYDEGYESAKNTLKDFIVR